MTVKPDDTAYMNKNKAEKRIGNMREGRGCGVEGILV